MRSARGVAGSTSPHNRAREPQTRAHSLRNASAKRDELLNAVDDLVDITGIFNTSNQSACDLLGCAYGLDALIDRADDVAHETECATGKAACCLNRIGVLREPTVTGNLALLATQLSCNVTTFRGVDLRLSVNLCLKAVEAIANLGVC